MHREGPVGCVVAYSTFDSDPNLVDSEFGNPADDSSSSGLSTAYGLAPANPNDPVACTDPGVLSGLGPDFGVTVPARPQDMYPVGSMAWTGFEVTTDYGLITIPQEPTRWVSDYEYTGSCQTINGATVFRYNPVPWSWSPVFGEVPLSGTHELDFNLGVDRLVTIASLQAQSWAASNA